MAFMVFAITFLYHTFFQILKACISPSKQSVLHWNMLPFTFFICSYSNKYVILLQKELLNFMPSIFSKIIKGEIPSHKLYEDDNFFSFLDIRPIRQGHALVIPKEEIDYIFDLDDNTIAGLHIICKKIAKAIEQVVPCQRIGMTVLGLEVPHAHVHLVPITESESINFNQAKSADPHELKLLAEKIRTKL